MIFTDTAKLPFPIGLYNQLFESRDIPIGQQTKPTPLICIIFKELVMDGHTHIHEHEHTSNC